MTLSHPENWETETMAVLYQAILERFIVTAMINELLRTGVKRPMKTGVLEHLKARQAAYNKQILAIQREVDRQ